MKYTDIIKQINLRESKLALTENKKIYKQMMNSVIQMYQQYAPDMVVNINHNISAIQKVYQRADRIIWALRWLRLGLVAKLPERTKQLPKEELDKVFDWSEKTVNKLSREFVSNGVHPNLVGSFAAEIAAGSFNNTMIHFMAYTDDQSQNYIKSIDDTVFQWQTPEQIQAILHKFESDWKENRDREMDHAEDMYDDAEKMIDFGDGFAWWNTNQVSCSAEGAASGHCGNQQNREGSGDRLLSLRQEVNRGDTRKQIPYLTFILDKDNKLGEMKGRNNNKPQPKYHPYIIALIKSKHVDGIKGGGHDPANNFSMNDLDQETVEELVALKPQLETLSIKYARVGLTDEIVHAIYDEISEKGLPEVHDIDIDTKNVVLEHWDDLEDLSHHLMFEPLDAAISYKDDIDDEITKDEYDTMAHGVSISADTMSEMLRYLSDRYTQRIADDMGIEGSVNDYKVQMEIADGIRNSKYYESLRHALVRTASGIKNFKPDDHKKYMDYMLEIAQRGIENHYLHIEENSDGSYQVNFAVDNFINVLSANADADDYGEDEDVRMLQSASSHDGYGNPPSWLAIDSYNTKEDWDNIIKPDNNPYSNYEEDEIAFINEYTNMIDRENDGDYEVTPESINHADAANWFQKHIDMTETNTDEEEFESMLTEMRRIAGIRL
jgi:hypothetical protein